MWSFIMPGLPHAFSAGIECRHCSERKIRMGWYFVVVIQERMGCFFVVMSKSVIIEDYGLNNKIFERG